MTKQYFLLIDTETTITGKVVDFGALLVNRKGEIISECSAIIKDVYKKEDLFYSNDNIELWGKNTLPAKYAMYDNMLDNGQRVLASVNSVNRWLSKVYAKYNPYITAYNLAFDAEKMRNTGLFYDIFEKSFCLWNMAKFHIAIKKSYTRFALENHYFTNRTAKGNMTIKTNAEVMAHYVAGIIDAEPHTAYEDAKDYELPILKYLLNKYSTNTLMKYTILDWRDFQVKNHF